MAGELKNLLDILIIVIGLPAAVIAAVVAARFWRGRVREEAEKGLSGDKELAYLAAVVSYMSELNRPMGYAESEYTPGAGSVVDLDKITARYVFRRAKSADRPGLTAGEVASGERGRPVHDVTATLRNSRQPIVLLGDPGSGKSVTLRHLAQSLAEQPKFVNHMPILPLYLHLGRYRQTVKGGLPGRFSDFVKSELTKVVPRGDVVLSVLDSALAQGRIFLLLDAMDEMPTRHYTERVEKINRFLTEESGRNQVVIACRRREYTGSLPHSELIIEPFLPSHIRTYLDKHWELYAGRLGTGANDPAVRDAYMMLAETSHPMHGLATNPFSLKLLANYFFSTGGRMPSVQADLFEDYIGRRLSVEGTRRKLGQSQQNNVLQQWGAMAFDAIRGNLGTFLRQPKRRKRSSAAETQGDAAAKALIGAVDIGVECGLMRKEADNAIRFEHHRLLEFLAAQHWDKQDKLLAIDSDHLANPWWRETLVLRAAITAQPETLIKKIARAIDRRYLAALKLQFKDEPTETEVEDSETLRLNGIVALELVLACTRQRVTSVSDELFTWLAPLLMAVPQHGTLIEKVRLARSLRGIPLKYSHPVLAALAATDSDWLAREVFGAIDEADYDTQEFSEVLSGLLNTKTNRTLIERLFAARGLSWRRILRAAPRHARRNLMRAVAADVIASVVLPIIGFVVIVSMWLRIGFPFSAADLAQTSTRLILAAILLTAAAFGVIISGWRLTLVNSLVSVLLFLLLPVLTAQRLTVALTAYLLLVGRMYEWGVWLRNPVARYFRLIVALPAWQRIFAFLMFAVPLVILADAKLGGALLRHIPVLPILVASVTIVVLVELALRWFERRRVRAIMRGGDYQTDDAALRAHLQACAEALHLPMLPRDGSRLLDHVVGLRLDESEMIQALEGVVAGQEHFLSNELIMQAIDRLDVRRRQRALGSA